MTYKLHYARAVVVDSSSMRSGGSTRIVELKVSRKRMYRTVLYIEFAHKQSYFFTHTRSPSFLMNFLPKQTL